MPVCHYHAIMVYGFMRDLLGEGLVAKSPTPRPERQAYVYYLLLSPTTVKIGTTRSLTQRLTALRAETQYVVAIERGGRELERQRHKEFADERRSNRREDFHLSDRLKKHIDELASQRDELIELAITY
jgi:hypothetical protein